VWVSHIARGDLGNSLYTKLPVATLIGQRAPATLELTAAAMLLTVLIGVPTGVIAALKPGSAADWIVTSLAGVAHAIPGFWLAILAILLFSLALGWLPPGGRVEFARDPGGAIRTLVLPSITLALATSASISRLVKSSMLEVLYEDYVRTAHAKGLAGHQVVVTHALRNALVPVITALGLQFGRMLGGAVVIESVFAWPGIGRMTLDAIGNRDYLVVQAALLLLVFIYILINLVTDLTYGLLDPRIRVGRRAAS
jgi:peptide/nickel transport system permease protein